MARKIRPEDLSEEELRRLLIEKRRDSRKKRLDQFRRSGRLVELSPAASSRPTNTLGGIDLSDPEPPSKEDARQQRRKKNIDRILLAVEIIAIVGLVFVLFNSVGLLQQLNNQLSAAIEQPTLTPTPLFDLVILPSGHRVVNGIPEFNYSEIPEHLQPAVQSYYNNLVIPTPSPEQANWIKIPKIGVDHKILQGDGWEQLKQGVGQHIGTANPGQPGNLVLSAHNDIYGMIFRQLDELEIGDEITIRTDLRSYTYVIDIETIFVEPTQGEVMAPTSNPTLTLISCYPYLINNQRIIVRATLVDG